MKHISWKEGPFFLRVNILKSKTTLGTKGRSKESLGEEMPIEYDYDEKSNILHGHPFGSVSTTDIVTYFKRVASDERISNGFIEIVHFEKVEDFIFSSEQAANIAMAYNEIREKKGISSTVFIGTSDMHYGIGRMFQAFIDFHCPGHDVHVVHNEEEALKAIEGRDG